MDELAAESPIADDEFLYRRVPASQNWVTPDAKTVDPLAFRPRESDSTGLSLARALYESAQQSATRGSIGRQFYIAVLSVRRMRAAGVEITPRPLESHPGHVEVAELTFENRRTDRSRELVQCLRDCVIAIEGPFDGHATRD